MPGLLNQLSSSRGSRYGQYTADTPFARAATGILDAAGAVARPAAALLPYGGLLSGYTAEDIATLQQPDAPAISIRNPLSPNIPGVSDNVLDISQHDLAGIGLLGDALDFLPAVGAGIGSLGWIGKQMARGQDWSQVGGLMAKTRRTPQMGAIGAKHDKALGDLSKWERVDFPDRTSLDPDDYYYHITSEPNAENVLKEGLSPGRPPTAGRGGGYDVNSEGRVFLTDADGVGFWQERIENHLFDQFDDPPDTVLMRIKKSDVGDLPIDELGTRDARAKAFYSDSQLPTIKSRNGEPVQGLLSKARPKEAGILGGAQGAAAQARAGNAAPQQALEHASLLEMQGAPREQIWAETADGYGYGVMRGPDGKLRYEIDDSGARLTGTGEQGLDDAIRDYQSSYPYRTEGGTTPALSDVLQHDELYQAYPELEASSIGVMDGPGGRAVGRDIFVGSNPGNDLSVTLHEATHAGPQDIEDFARGGSPAGMQAEYDATFKTWMDLQNDPDVMAIVDKAESWVSDARIKRPDDDALAAMREWEMRGKYPEYRRYADVRNKIEGFPQDGGMADYLRLAGEAEARAVQARMNMSPAERAANPFFDTVEADVPYADQIVRMGGGDAMSLPMDEASRMQRAREMGFGGDLYHASKQDIDEFIPGYEDGLTFVTDNPEMANDWLGKGKYSSRIGAEEELAAVEDAYFRTKQGMFDYEELNKLEGVEFTEAYDAALKRFNDLHMLRPEDSYSAIYPVRSNVKKTFDPRKNFEEIEDFLRQQGHGLPELIKEGKHKEGNWIIYENPKVVAELKRKGYDSMLIKESAMDGAPHETLAIFDPKNIRSKFAKFDPAKKDSANLLASIAGAGLLGSGAIKYGPGLLYNPESM